MRLMTSLAVLAALTVFDIHVVAQTSEQTASEQLDQTLFTQAELETLAAPVALFPDTLLMQILVASTAPLDVVKASSYVVENISAENETRQTYVETQDWDESVKVLAIAFPSVLVNMAQHVEWTESMGNAMLTQSDDVMAAIQLLRTQAINNGALASGDQQTVEVTQENEVIIQPTDPEIVYVPQYDHNTVYSNDLGNVLASSAIIFGTVAVIDAIFDDDDDWNNYWGCRNCGGWNGRPIINRPDIDIDMDGNVNIGNNVNIGDRDKLGWKPDDRKADQARERIQNGRGESGATTLPIERKPSAQDNLRNSISQRTGINDLSQNSNLANAAAGLPQIGNTRPAQLNAADRARAIDRTKALPQKPIAAATPKLPQNRPAASRPKVPQKPATRPASIKKPSVMKPRSSGHKVKAASRRGKPTGGRARGKRN